MNRDRLNDLWVWGLIILALVAFTVWVGDDWPTDADRANRPDCGMCN